MRRRFLLLSAVAAGVLAIAGVAPAATIDFTFGAPLTGNTWTDGGVTLNAIALGGTGLTSASNYGLGVAGGIDPMINPMEGIMFSFSPTVVVNTITLTQMAFGRYDTDNVLLLTMSGGQSVHPSVSELDDSVNRLYTWNVADFNAGTFWITSGDAGNHSFGIGAISVDYTNTAGSAVPLPAAMWSGLALLGGLAAVKFRRRNV
jgi:hypothetical protein